MTSLTPSYSTDTGISPNPYIYRIISTAPRQDGLLFSPTDQLAYITSSDSLHFTTANLTSDGHVQRVHESVTCLERANDVSSNVVITAGRDGFIRFWDKRSKTKALEMQSPHKLISSIVCDAANHFVAAGIENPEDGPQSSPIYVWDQRNHAAPIRSYVESHTDTVTSLQLHPAHPTLLLSSSTDGLINIFDTSIAEEDDALYQVINHGSATAHAGFMYPSTDMYALGTDETVSFYALQSQKEEEEEPSPKVLGDVREALGCEYLVDMHWMGRQPYVAAGKHSEQKLDLIPITKGDNGPLDYSFNLQGKMQLPNAHGEEIVRDLFTDTHTHTTYTCGEDGSVRAWKASEDEDMEVADDETEPTRKAKDKDRKEKRKEKKKEKEKARFKPY
ncbi:hypothetical protein LEMA_P003130.1 [Plenodomus lingam JN3]|uniref:Uncharacterized protein n=1 Tax=Leptosphaeria maculans (strain JN3 / isolate v23.1.3 / race Av1-4-5-6-7-8) TaxID=985895 RepID=E5AE87_LEPMJ|nr:hypothetical protein LEMA_P003130.1 [Plenodomus lingam JN3]CBY01526.1 hypothetical protein LEMA_P003130.1 [Plenodomus lingam JN3]